MHTVWELVEHSRRMGYGISNVTVFKLMREAGLEPVRETVRKGVERYLWGDEALEILNAYITRKTSPKANVCLQCGCELDNGKPCQKCRAFSVVRKFCTDSSLNFDRSLLKHLKSAVDSLL